MRFVNILKNVFEKQVSFGNVSLRLPMFDFECNTGIIMTETRY